MASVVFGRDAERFSRAMVEAEQRLERLGALLSLLLEIPYSAELEWWRRVGQRMVALRPVLLRHEDMATQLLVVTSCIAQIGNFLELHRCGGPGAAVSREEIREAFASQYANWVWAEEMMDAARAAFDRAASRMVPPWFSKRDFDLMLLKQDDWLRICGFRAEAVGHLRGLNSELSDAAGCERYRSWYREHRRSGEGHSNYDMLLSLEQREVLDDALFACQHREVQSAP